MTTTTRRTVEWVHAPGGRRLDPATAGFWRSILAARYAGDVWKRVSARIRAGELGAAARLRPLGKRQRLYELRVYVSDVSDRDQVLQVRRTMRRELGFVAPLACYTWDGRRRWFDPGARETAPKTLWRKTGGER